MAAGAAIASSNNAAATSNAYTSGYVAGSTNTANTASAYNAGVATGAAAATGAYAAGVAAGGGNPNIVYAMNAIYPVLPAGALPINKNGNSYYLSGNTWFAPSYGANGVYYRVVPTP
jgi:hypothetical protein